MRSSYLILCANTTDDLTGAAERLQNKHDKANCRILYLDHKKAGLVPDSLLIQALENQRLRSRADIRSTLTCAVNWFSHKSDFRAALKQTISEFDATPSP
ncbi:MAG: hypothetical protein P1U40_09775 [Coxiellaceae bacterium]|nr:hypothetical protein [Coxiellaceae bacterium]